MCGVESAAPRWRQLGEVDGACDDEIGRAACTGSTACWPASAAGVWQPLLEARFHATAALRAAHAEAVPPDRLPRRRHARRRVDGPAPGARLDEGAALFDALLRGAPAPGRRRKRGTFTRAQRAILARAQQTGLLHAAPAGTVVTVDATGLEARHVSRHYQVRRGDAAATPPRATRIARTSVGYGPSSPRWPRRAPT